MSEKKYDVVFTHQNCVDGILSAIVVKKAIPDIEIVFWKNHKELPPEDLWKNKNVLITDFSFSAKLMQQLMLGANTVLVLDHHKTAQDEIGHLDCVKIDNGRSGSQITWDWFNKDQPYPEIIKHCGEADLGKYELPETALIMDYAWRFKFEIPVWEQFWEDLETRKSDIVAKAEAISEWKKDVIQSQLRSAFETELAGERVFAINANMFKNEFAAELCKKGKFAIVYSGQEGRWYWSLRSNGFNVEKIAKKFGGGGHANAAAFVTDYAPSKLISYDD